MPNNSINLPENTTETGLSLRSCIAEVMKHYFSSLKGEDPKNIYEFFIEEVEEPLLIATMNHTNQNQSETARILGVSRGTLRTMLKKFGMLTEDELGED
jgi:Fis family transcriptional regulator